MKQLEQALIEGYQIQRHLAQGGMANIYLAYDIEREQTVAIKMVHESAGEYSKRFQREVKAMAGLTHAHILPVFDYGEHESWYFLVTPYIEYGTLSDRLADGPLSLAEVDLILCQLAAALQFAHEQGIVHRDVKPSNVLMRDGNHVYLADFGLVKRVGQETGLTVTGYLIGTPEYLAPELAEEDATPQSDVYSLGILLYQMLAGRVPFKANTPMGVYLCHIRDEPQAPTIFNPTIPLAVESVILHAIEKDPQQRYQSAQELYLAYKQAIKGFVSESTENQVLLAPEEVESLVSEVPQERMLIVPEEVESLVSENTEKRKVLAPQEVRSFAIEGTEGQALLAPDIQPANVSIRKVKQRQGMGRPLAAAILCIGFFILLSSTFFPGWQNGHFYVADAQSRKLPASSASTKRIASPIMHIAPALSIVSVTPTPKPTPIPAPASYNNGWGYDGDQDGDDNGGNDDGDSDGGSRSSHSSPSSHHSGGGHGWWGH